MHRESDCAVRGATVSSALMLPSVKAWHVYVVLVGPQGGATVPGRRSTQRYASLAVQVGEGSALTSLACGSERNAEPTLREKIGA